jgi:hypothetical protein
MFKQACLMAGLVVVFAGGLVLGNFATTTWPDFSAWFGGGKPLDGIVLDKLKSELDLTPAQAAKIAPIISASCSNLCIVAEEHRAERLALIDEISAAIAPQLTAGQRRRLAAFDAELQNRAPARRDLRIVALY